MSLRRHRRRCGLQKSAATHSREHEDVKEMHAAEHQHDDADFATDRFKYFPKICRCNSLFQSERNVADVDKIEANHQEMIDGPGLLCVSVKRINQKNAAILVERLRDPDGERNAQRDVDDVSPNDWSHDGFLSCFAVSVKGVCFISKI